MKLTRNALVHFSFLGLRFILNCGCSAGGRIPAGGLTYVLVAFCYCGGSAGLSFIELHTRRGNNGTIHLQNLNCLASLRTKVMPASVSFEAIQRKRQMYPWRGRQAANRSSLAYTLASCLSFSYCSILTGFDSHLCISVDFC